MKLKLNNTIIYVEPLFIVMGACFLIPAFRNYFENYFTCFLFITFHELAHMLIATIFKIKIVRINVLICGLNIVLDRKEEASAKWLLIYFIGPLSNALLSVIFRKIPLIFYTNLLLAVINLLPINPLDGYGLLKTVLKILKTKKIEIILKCNEMIWYTLLIILGIVQLVMLKNPSVFLLTSYIFLNREKLKGKYKPGLYQKYYKNITNF